MRRSPTAPAAVLLVLALAFSVAGPTRADPDVYAMQQELERTFLAVQSAESRGANVSGLVPELNRAVSLISAGDPGSLAEARSVLEEVNSSLPALVAEGESKLLTSRILLFSTIGTFAAFGVLSYLYLPRLLWRTWLRLKGDWEVSASQPRQADRKADKNGADKRGKR